MFIFRPYEPQDLNFIQSSWGSSYYKGSDFHHSMSPETFHNYHRPIRERILSQPTLAIIICSSKEDPSQIIGWIAVEPLFKRESMIIHYIYVKQLYKDEGIATELFGKVIHTRPVFMSHMTDKAWRIVAEKKDFIYCPHLI